MPLWSIVLGSLNICLLFQNAGTIILSNAFVMESMRVGKYMEKSDAIQSKFNVLMSMY